MKLAYQCENCSRTHSLRAFIFGCWDCGKEICDDCMRGWQTCKECGASKSDEELSARYNEEDNYGDAAQTLP